jgi:hypothetical protein
MCVCVCVEHQDVSTERTKYSEQMWILMIDINTLLLRAQCYAILLEAIRCDLLPPELENQTAPVLFAAVLPFVLQLIQGS